MPGVWLRKIDIYEQAQAVLWDDVVVIYHDNYYRRQDGIPFEQRVKVNYDHPDSLETDLLVEHLKELKAGKTIEVSGLRLQPAQPIQRDHQDRAETDHPR